MGDISATFYLGGLAVQLTLRDNGADRQLRIGSCGQHVTMHLPPEDHAEPEFGAEAAQPDPAAPGAAAAVLAPTGASGV
jgi:hypothetical protein